MIESAVMTINISLKDTKKLLKAKVDYNFLFKHFALPIKYKNLFGEYYILSYWSQQNQTRLVLGKSVDSVLNTAVSLSKDSRIRFKDTFKLLKVFVTPPSIKLQQKILLEEYVYFYCYRYVEFVSQNLDKYAEQYKIQKCPEYLVGKEFNCGKYEEEHHLYCVNCSYSSGYVFSKDFNPLSKKYYDRWIESGMWEGSKNYNSAMENHYQRQQKNGNSYGWQLLGSVLC